MSEPPDSMTSRIGLEKCIVCGRTNDDGYGPYCTLHTRAYRNIREAYMEWCKAYGSLTLQQFLTRLSKLPDTGERVKELADFLARNSERWNP